MEQPVGLAFDAEESAGRAFARSGRLKARDREGELRRPAEPLNERYTTRYQIL